MVSDLEEVVPGGVEVVAGGLSPTRGLSTRRS